MDGECFVHGLIDTAYNELYGLAIGKIYKPEQLAYYNKANQFPKLITVNIDGSISSIMLPTLAQEQDDKQKVKSMMRRSIKTSSFLLFPMMFGLAAIAGPLVKIVLTDKWLSVVPLMQLLCFSYALWPIHTINIQAINAMGRSDIFLKLEIIKKILGVMGLLISIPFGLQFMICIKIIISVINSFVNAYPNKKLLNYSYTEQIRDISLNLATSLFMGLIVYFMNKISINIYILMALQIISGIVIYFGISIWTKNDTFKYILGMIQERKKSENYKENI